MVIKKCTCLDEFQDRTYGKGNRACNETANGKCRCTVCGKEMPK